MPDGLSLHAFFYFNSTVVQLEVNSQMVSAVDVTKFQFYCSPIRSCYVLAFVTVRSYFNSTVVQLEGFRQRPAFRAVHRFQFYCSPIRSVVRALFNDAVLYFNSTVVQLEVSH